MSMSYIWHIRIWNNLKFKIECQDYANTIKWITKGSR